MPTPSSIAFVSQVSTRLDIWFFLLELGLILLAASINADSSSDDEYPETEHPDGDAQDTSKNRPLKKREIDALQRQMDADGEEIHKAKGKRNASKRDLFADAEGRVYAKPKSEKKSPGSFAGYNIKKVMKNK